MLKAAHAIEATVRGLSPIIRLAARTEHSRPAVAALKPWFEKQLSMISSSSTLAQDIHYALNHCQGLTRFLEDGRLELDTNPVENAIRPVCFTRKNALFAGNEVGAENWALLASIVTLAVVDTTRPEPPLRDTKAAIQSRSASATNSGPLSERMCAGMPRETNSSQKRRGRNCLRRANTVQGHVTVGVVASVAYNALSETLALFKVPACHVADHGWLYQ